MQSRKLFAVALCAAACFDTVNGATKIEKECLATSGTMGVDPVLSKAPSTFFEGVSADQSLFTFLYFMRNELIEVCANDLYVFGLKVGL